MHPFPQSLAIFIGSQVKYIIQPYQTAIILELFITIKCRTREMQVHIKKAKIKNVMHRFLLFYHF